jgi:hypothetical protein
MSESQTNVNDFQAILGLAATDERAEKFVRGMIRRSADSCPIDVLLRLGQSLVEARRSELRSHALQN